MKDEDNLLFQIRLINSAGIGPVNYHKLVDFYGSEAKAIEAISDKKEVPTQEWAEEEIKRASDFGALILSYKDEQYPPLLRQLKDAPPLLYVKGNLSFLKTPLNIALVGTRNATIMGRKLASRIAFELTENNIMVISGMARGIDSAAHKGAMYGKKQAGPTIAVLGTGIDVVYPRENQILYEQITDQGVLISEYPMGTLAQSSNFPRRNRIIAGLSNGVVVIEATRRSGSLITASIAEKIGRKVFSVPGFPMEARSEGPNYLLRQGAVLVENSEDIIHFFMEGNFTNKLSDVFDKDKNFLINPLDNYVKTVDISSKREGSEKDFILDCLSVEGVDIDMLIRSCNLDTSTVLMLLIELEMEDKIIRLPGNKVALTGKKRK